jgi:alpha-tubulin suppressor-like RCC1 family protein
MKIFSVVLSFALCILFILQENTAFAATSANNIQNSTVSASIYSSLAIKEDGSLWAWEISNSTGIDSYFPSKIMDNAAAVSAGRGITIAISTDGSLWAWGYQKSNLKGVF